MTNVDIFFICLWIILNFGLSLNKGGKIGFLIMLYFSELNYLQYYLYILNPIYFALTIFLKKQSFWSSNITLKNKLFLNTIRTWSYFWLFFVQKIYILEKFVFSHSESVNIHLRQIDDNYLIPMKKENAKFYIISSRL